MCVCVCKTIYKHGLKIGIFNLGPKVMVILVLRTPEHLEAQVEPSL